MALPRPDINIFLHVPAKIAYDLVDNKGKREYLGNKKRDIHEQDIRHLEQAENSFLEVVKLFPHQFKIIQCVQKEELLSIQEIEDKIWEIVKKFVK